MTHRSLPAIQADKEDILSLQRFYPFGWLINYQPELHLENCIHVISFKITSNVKDRKTSKDKKNQKTAVIYASMTEAKVKQKGHRADALALRADERRDKLR